MLFPATQCHSVFYNRSSANEQVPATILGPSQHPGEYLRTEYEEVNGKAVIHEAAALHRLEFHIRNPSCANAGGYLHVVHQPFCCVRSGCHSEYKRLMRYTFPSSFLGANVAVQSLSVRGRLGCESRVIPQNGAHLAHTVHPRPLGEATTTPVPNPDLWDALLLAVDSAHISFHGFGHPNRAQLRKFPPVWFKGGRRGLRGGGAGLCGPARAMGVYVCRSLWFDARCGGSVRVLGHSGGGVWQSPGCVFSGRWLG